MPVQKKTKDVMAQFDELYGKIGSAKSAVKEFIWGQDRVVDLSLVTLFSGGHMLLVGLPGLGKTRLISVLSTVMGLESNRIQCTPDLMPADITGSDILSQKDKEDFRFVEGPVFCQFLMADEINRASPRTQSALLQAMQEHVVTVGGKDYSLPKPFHVMATQNPLEQEGTYPLPEAQLDRFLMQIDVGYPNLEDEKRMILATTAGDEPDVPTCLTAQDVLDIQALIQQMPIGESIVDAILEIVRNARPDQSENKNVKSYVSWGAGPRAAQALMLAVRARALLDGRHAPSIEDVLFLAEPILKHRMALTFSARAASVTIEEIIYNICKKYA